MPLTILLIEKTIRSGRWAGFGLSASVALQILNGATEVVLYNLYLGAVYALYRLGSMVVRRDGRRAGSFGVGQRQALLLTG